MAKGQPGVFMKIIQMNLESTGTQNATVASKLKSLRENKSKKVEFVVKKYGKQKKKLIDPEKNLAKANQIRQILKKD